MSFSSSSVLQRTRVMRVANRFSPGEKSGGHELNLSTCIPDRLLRLMRYIAAAAVSDARNKPLVLLHVWQAPVSLLTHFPRVFPSLTHYYTIHAFRGERNDHRAACLKKIKHRRPWLQSSANRNYR